MESSTRTLPRKTKKWSKTEWLLLLAPLLVIGGLAIMNFAPQVKQDYRERRDYGSNRPYAVFYAGNDLTFNPIAFSLDGKYLAAARLGILPSNNGNHGVEVWDASSRQRVSSWPVDGKETFVNILKFVSPNVLDVGLVTGGTRNPQKIDERRDVRSGKFLSSQKVHLLPEVPPSVLYSASAFSSYVPYKARPEKLGNTKMSVKLFTVKTLFKAGSSFMTDEDKTFVVQWMAQLYDAKGRKLRKPFAIVKCFDRSSSHGESGSSMSFCSSPDGKTLLIQPRTAQFFARGITQDMDEWIEAFDTTTGRSLWKRVLTQRGGQNDLLRAIAFSPNSDLTALFTTKYKGAVLQSGDVELRNTRDGTIIRHLNVYPSSKNYMISLYMQFSPDCRLLAIPQDDRLELWDVSDLR